MHLGEFDQPLLFFGGPYSNLPALLALKQQATALEIPPERIICTGDIVAYCGQPYETVEVIREWGIHVLMGNCEAAFADNAQDCGCGFSEGSACDLLAAQWFHFANQQLSHKQRRWFAQLPRDLRFTFYGQACQVVHGSVTAINQFLFPSSDDALLAEQFQHTDATIIIAGHSGIPFSKKVGAKLWHNAGAIGMPANDGTANTWFSLMSLGQQHIKIEYQKLHYSYPQAQQAMVSAGLSNGYMEALSTGLWPSVDILPAPERRQQGLALVPKALCF